MGLGRLSWLASSHPPSSQHNLVPSWLVAGLAVCLTGWWVGWLAVWLAGGWAGCLASWWLDWLAVWPAGLAPNLFEIMGTILVCSTN